MLGVGREAILYTVYRGSAYLICVHVNVNNLKGSLDSLACYVFASHRRHGSQSLYFTLVGVWNHELYFDFLIVGL